MEKAVQLLAPKGFWGWITRTALVLLPVSAINIPAHYYLGGSWEESVISVIARTWLVALPFTILGLALVSYLDRLRTELNHLAHTDALTGLPNRRAFLETAATAIAERQGTLMMIDVDHFKTINDTYGHAIGDLCLIELGKMLCRIANDTDLVGRLGGEEFALWLDTQCDRRVGGVADALTSGFTFPVEANAPEEQRITVSIGVTACATDASMSKLMAQADSALYAAKTAGRARMMRHDRPITDLMAVHG